MILADLTYEEVEKLAADLGVPSYRAKQLYAHITRFDEYDEMSDLPAAFREKLKSLYAGYAEEKYTVAEFLSGGEELYHNTRDLLLYNRRKLAEAEVQREKLAALPGNTGSQRHRPIVQWE